MCDVMKQDGFAALETILKYVEEQSEAEANDLLLFKI